MYAWSMIEQLTGDIRKDKDILFSFEFHGRITLKKPKLLEAYVISAVI